MSHLPVLLGLLHRPQATCPPAGLLDLLAKLVEVGLHQVKADYLAPSTLGHRMSQGAGNRSRDQKIGASV